MGIEAKKSGATLSSAEKSGAKKSGAKNSFVSVAAPPPGAICQPKIGHAGD
jgi:hypothetical protein